MGQSLSQAFQPRKRRRSAAQNAHTKCLLSFLGHASSDTGPDKENEEPGQVRGLKRKLLKTKEQSEKYLKEVRNSQKREKRVRTHLATAEVTLTECHRVLMESEKQQIEVTANLEAMQEVQDKMSEEVETLRAGLAGMSGRLSELQKKNRAMNSQIACWPAQKQKTKAKAIKEAFN